MNNILVIIVTYNAMKWVDRCFNSLAHSSVPVDVYVIDNGSTDGTQDYIQSKYPNVIFVQNDKNEGFGAANNKGMLYAIKNGYKYIYLLNQDAWVEPNAFRELTKVMESKPEYGIISPLQLTGDGMSLDRNFKFNVEDKRCMGFLTDYENNSCKEIYSTEFVMAAHWFLRTTDLLKVGLFSPAFRHYGEDGNLVSRYKYWGYKIGICPAARAYHDRQYRQDPPEKLLYLSYIKVLADLNNPLKVNYMKTWLKFFLKVITIKDASLMQRYSCIKDTISCLGSSSKFRRIYKDKNCISILNNYRNE